MPPSRAQTWRKKSVFRPIGKADAWRLSGPGIKGQDFYPATPHFIYHQPHVQTFSTSQSGTPITAFLTPPKIIKTTSGKGKAPPTHVPEVGTKWVSFPRTQQMRGEPIHLSKRWGQLVSLQSGSAAWLSFSKPLHWQGQWKETVNRNRQEMTKTERANRVKKEWWRVCFCTKES